MSYDIREHPDFYNDISYYRDLFHEWYEETGERAKGRSFTAGQWLREVGAFDKQVEHELRECVYGTDLEGLSIESIIRELDIAELDEIANRLMGDE